MTIADRREGHANIEGNGPEWQRPFLSPMQKNQSQQNHLHSRTYQAARVSQIIHLDRAVQPRVHSPLHTLASQLHNRIELHWRKAARRLEQRRVMQPVSSGTLLEYSNSSLGPTSTEKHNSPAGSSISEGRGRNEMDCGWGRQKW